MTQFKEKASSFGTHSGLLTYPILMASDILIHKANEVPVGDDQTQHLELTRNIAERFNTNYGEIFPIPEKTSGKSGARLMSLRHPENKMSKSSDDINGTIYFNDEKDNILKKFKSSVTDSENIVRYDPKNKPGISNLIEIKDLSAGDHFKPAVIYDMGGKFDKSFNEGVWNGVQKFTKETGVEVLEFEVTNETQREQAMRRMAQKGATVILGVGFAQADAIAKVAAEYPQKQFSIIDVSWLDAPNLRQ